MQPRPLHEFQNSVFNKIMKFSEYYDLSSYQSSRFFVEINNYFMLRGLLIYGNKIGLRYSAGFALALHKRNINISSYPNKLTYPTYACYIPDVGFSGPFEKVDSGPNQILFKDLLKAIIKFSKDYPNER